jgi:hypothetical protein
MHRILVGLAVAVLAAGPATANDKTDVMAPRHQFIDGFNKGGAKIALAACADQTSIIDEFPPHEWHDAGACSNWANDFGADAEKNGITDGVVTLGNPRHIDIAGGRAYVAFPANYAFKQKRKTIKEAGSMLNARTAEKREWLAHYRMGVDEPLVSLLPTQACNPA